MEDILIHRKSVSDNIAKAFGYENSEDIISKSEENFLEKAHQDGDIHPNGKWVWNSSAAGGKGDWRVAKKESTSSVDGKRTGGDASKKDENKTLSEYAKETNDETLKKVIADKKASEELKNEAKKELEGRNSESNEKNKEKSDFKDTAQYMFDTIENYDGDGSYMGYLYGDDEGIDKKIAKIFDIIMAGGNKNVQVKLKEFDWKEDSKAKEWKEKMEKSGYKVSDLAPGGDTYVYAAFRDKKKENTNEKTSSSDDIKELFQKINKLLPVKKGDTLLAIHKTLDGKNTYNIITKTLRGTYRAAEVDLDNDSYKFESNPYGTEREAMNFSETGKSNARYKDVSKQLNNWKRIELEKPDNNLKSNKASDFKIVHAPANLIADKLSEVLDGKVLTSVMREAKYSKGIKVKTSVIQVDDKKIYIHDGVYEQSYNSKGFNRLQGFTIESESGKRLIYKLNGTKTRFTNAYTTTAGELGRYLKNDNWV